jgi:hypothetical protein
MSLSRWPINSLSTYQPRALGQHRRSLAVWDSPEALKPPQPRASPARCVARCPLLPAARASLGRPSTLAAREHRAAVIHGHGLRQRGLQFGLEGRALAKACRKRVKRPEPVESFMISLMACHRPMGGRTMTSISRPASRSASTIGASGSATEKKISAATP